MMKILLNKITGNEVVEDFEAVEDVEAGVDGKISFEIFFMKLNANFKKTFVTVKNKYNPFFPL